MRTAELPDLLIVGAGPSGSAAAIRARQLDLSVHVIDRAKFPRPRQCNGWLGPAGVELAESCGVTPRSAAAVEFSGLKLHSWDLRKKTEVADKELCGWIVERDRFDAALLKRAAESGARTAFGVRPTGMTLREDRAELALDNGRVAAGRIVLIADGAESQTAALAQLDTASAQQGIGCCWATFASKREKAGVEIVVGQGRASQLVVISRKSDSLRVMLLTRDSSTPAKVQFQEFLSRARDAGLLPDSDPLELIERRSPAGAALDIDRHVGKRFLLIGEAGGFVAAFSNEGIYPSMKSGWIAAETAHRALAQRLAQDELVTFSDAWRAALADYLRMPNTDLALLVPLVFNNIQMARRVARAFLLGQGF